MNNFKISIILICALLIIGFTSHMVQAEEGYIPFGTGITDGKPVFHTGSCIAYYLWKTGNIVHVRWTSDGCNHIFKGRISANTAITNVVEVATEADDYTIKPGVKEIDFWSTTSTGLDGFSFQLNSPTRVKIALFVDGKHIEPSYIYLGKDNAQPPGNPIIFYKP